MLMGKSLEFFILLTLTYVTFYYSNNHTSSRNYTGKGTAAYPNGDSYTGDFKDGVSIQMKEKFSIL